MFSGESAWSFKRLTVALTFCTAPRKHRAPQIAYQKAALSREIVQTSFTGSLDCRVLGDKIGRLAGRHGHRHKAIAQKTRTAYGKFAARGNFYIIENPQRNIHPLSGASQPRPIRDTADFRARQQNVGAFEQAAGVRESYR
jgi:hypothetical protein